LVACNWWFPVADLVWVVWTSNCLFEIFVLFRKIEAIGGTKCHIHLIMFSNSTSMLTIMFPLLFRVMELCVHYLCLGVVLVNTFSPEI
jgi:hypothetical protein